MTDNGSCDELCTIQRTGHGKRGRGTGWKGTAGNTVRGLSQSCHRRMQDTHRHNTYMLDKQRTARKLTTTLYCTVTRTDIGIPGPHQYTSGLAGQAGQAGSLRHTVKENEILRSPGSGASLLKMGQVYNYCAMRGICLLNRAISPTFLPICPGHSRFHQTYFPPSSHPDIVDSTRCTVFSSWGSRVIFKRIAPLNSDHGPVLSRLVRCLGFLVLYICCIQYTKAGYSRRQTHRNAGNKGTRLNIGIQTGHCT